jgi:hypothetical protein
MYVCVSLCVSMCVYCVCMVKNAPELNMLHITVHVLCPLLYLRERERFRDPRLFREDVLSSWWSSVCLKW